MSQIISVFRDLEEMVDIKKKTIQVEIIDIYGIFVLKSLEHLKVLK